jgi:hypothetical protein
MFVKYIEGQILQRVPIKSKLNFRAKAQRRKERINFLERLSEKKLLKNEFCHEIIRLIQQAVVVFLCALCDFARDRPKQLQK